jgi:hypothetical protein
MDFVPIQFSDLKIGQPLLWDLFDQNYKPFMKRGDVLNVTDEELLKKSSSIFRKVEISSRKNGSNTNKNFEFDFDDMQLKVGDKLQLRLHSGAKGLCCINNVGYCTATVIGYFPNHSLLVSMPKTDQFAGQPLIEGDKVLVRLFSRQYAFSFTVFVDKLINLPFKYVHLSFPKHIQGQTIRKSRRIQISIEAKANVENESIPLIITNLSAGGAEINTHNKLGEIDTPMELPLKVKIHDKEVMLLLQSTIRSFKVKQGILIYGVEFTELDAEQNFLLRSFICQELVKNPKNL